MKRGEQDTTKTRSKIQTKTRYGEIRQDKVKTKQDETSDNRLDLFPICYDGV